MRVTRSARGGRFAVAGALFSLLLASCTSSGDPSLQLNAEGYNNSAAMMPPADGASGDAGSGAAMQPQMTANCRRRWHTCQPQTQPRAKPDEAAISAVNCADKDRVAPAQHRTCKPRQLRQVCGRSQAGNGPAPSSQRPPPPRPEAPKKKSFFGSMFGPSSASAAPARSDRSGAAAPGEEAGQGDDRREHP